MKLSMVELPNITMPRLGLAAFRRRIVFHAVFLLLAAATLALALTLLVEEKQRSYQRYEQGFRKTLGEIAALLRHPTGQLALLNPGEQGLSPLSPLMLPFAAIDFDDPVKAQRAVEMSGCAVQYARSGATLCAAVGSSAYAGGYLYLVGSLAAGPLQGREHASMDFSRVHRARITLQLPGEQQAWIAPFEAMAPAATSTQRGRLTGFALQGDSPAARPQREFRGWLWREGDCIDPAAAAERCTRRTLYSIRLPVEALRAALFATPRPPWPPLALERIGVRVELLAPGSGPALFDSSAGDALPTYSLSRLDLALQPGETLTVRKGTQRIATRQGAADPEAVGSPWLTRLIRRLPVQERSLLLEASDSIVTPLGRYELSLQGDLRSLDRSLAATATRLSWLVGAMLAAIALAWLIIELGLIRRVAVLTRRAAAVSHHLQEQRVTALEVADLRGRDELGILAGTLGDLLQRVQDNLRREQLRAEHERDMWHAVGHEIMSPLQSLMVLHGDAADPSHRYVQRMQQAVRVLYGSAPPSEALASATLALESLDLDEFLRHVAANAGFAGIADVSYMPAAAAVWVRAEAYSLEDVVTHVLRNAARYRLPGSPIRLSLAEQADGDGKGVRLCIHNQGPAIAPELLDRIFEYGVSDQEPEPGSERRGQGLFVAKTYMAKMNGTISCHNVADGVEFVLELPH